MTGVVVTGVGVVAPGALGADRFERALRSMQSGVQRAPELEELGCRCRDAGLPPDLTEAVNANLAPAERFGANQVITHGVLAAIEAHAHAGLPRANRDAPADPDTGIVMGTGCGGVETVVAQLARLSETRSPRRLGSAVIEQIMGSGAASRAAGVLGLGNRVCANSSACATGTEAIVLATEWIAAGYAKRMIAGGTEGASAYAWAGFDALRLMAQPHPDGPHASSRPLAADAAGFIPAGGAGALLLEDERSARDRGARILARVLGGAITSGGQRSGGTMTAPSPDGVARCLRQAIDRAGVDAHSIDGINGHFTGTMADTRELAAWAQALDRGPSSFPKVQATKSLIGHAMGAAGAIESVACVLQLERGFFHGTANLEHLHPEIAAFGDALPRRTESTAMQVIAKASFGFGDVNAAVLFGNPGGRET